MSTRPPTSRPLYRRRWPYFALAGAILVSAVTGASLGTFLRFDLPDVGTLEDYNPPEMSRVLGADGSVVGTFAQSISTEATRVAPT